MSAGATLLRIGDAVVVGVSTDDAAGDVLHQATGRSDIRVSRRASGRPRLDPPYPELGVSIAERGDLRVVAFSPSARVGVDVEIDDPTLDPARLAADHFSDGEAAWVSAWPIDQRNDAFLRLWCAKEALLKITGRGVFDGVREPDLSRMAAHLKADETVCAVPAATDRGPCAVTVRRLGPHVIALAVER